MSCLENLQTFESTAVRKHFDLDDLRKLDYLELKIYADTEKESICEVKFVLQPTGCGERVLLLCPMCDCRARILYLYKFDFICRKCTNLNYKSSSESKINSIIYKIQYLCMEYNIEFDYTKPRLSLVKPKHMRIDKWKKVYKKLDYLITQLENYMLSKMGHLKT